MRFIHLLPLLALCLQPLAAQKRKKQASRGGPEKSPELARHYINLKTSPRSPQAEPVTTSLPLELEPKDQVAFIGSGLLDNARHYGYFETLLHQRFPDHQLGIRNFSWPADEVDLQPRCFTKVE